VTNRSAALSLLNHVSCFVRKRLSHSSVGIEGLALYRVPLTTYRLESLSAQVGGAGVEPPGKTPVAVKRDARVGWFSLIGTDGSNPSSSSGESITNSAGLADVDRPNRRSAGAEYLCFDLRRLLRLLTDAGAGKKLQPTD
jgi:hypothetical protein